MQFRTEQTINTSISVDHPTAFLVPTSWDDWFRYETVSTLWFCRPDEGVQLIGELKVGRRGMSGHRSPDDMQPISPERRAPLQSRFETLPTDYFSLGQSASYYETLNSLGDETRDEILRALRDVAFIPAIFMEYQLEDVMGVSLLRNTTSTTVRGQYNRLSNGGARLSHYSFGYSMPRSPNRQLVQFNFQVQPASLPPTNMHVLIGRNGVGKTHILHHMTRAFVESGAAGSEVGEFTTPSEGSATPASNMFAGLVSVSFSAFDTFPRLTEPRNRNKAPRYTYIGLKKKPESGGSTQSTALKSHKGLATEFSVAVLECQSPTRRLRWKRALKMLQSDPLFEAIGIAELGRETEDTELIRKEAKNIFGRLSSGHKVVVLTITRLVLAVEERTLVLLDEPEAHLHPPLLSAFLRSLSDLLVDRNGVAIVATHSPVILQEVPQSCVWKVRRSGLKTDIERPTLETFGENVGVLTRDVFGLEVTKSGFHQLLAEAVDTTNSTYESIIESYGGQLGGEARALLRSAIALKDTQK